LNISRKQKKSDIIEAHRAKISKATLLSTSFSLSDVEATVKNGVDK
jgi:hypothetical protein